MEIIRCLPGNDLLSLSKTCKFFRNTIMTSIQPRQKLRFTIDFNQSRCVNLLAMGQFVGVHKFNCLRIKDVNFVSHNPSSRSASKLRLQDLLIQLSATVSEIIIEGRTSCEILTFIANLMLHKLVVVSWKSVLLCEDNAINYIIPPSLKYALKELSISNTDVSKVLHIFGRCNNIEKFRYIRPLDLTEGFHAAELTDFLSTKSKLTHLVINSIGLDWNRLTHTNLLQLDVRCDSTIEDQSATAKLIQRNETLKKVRLVFYDFPSRVLIESIAGLTLSNLTLECWGHSDPGTFVAESLEDISTSTTQHLEILDETGVAASLLKIFTPLKTAKLNFMAERLDLSDIPLSTVELLSPRLDSHRTFLVRFDSNQPPINMQRFQLIALQFMREFATLVKGITIGSNDWNRSAAIPNSFFKFAIKTRGLLFIEGFNVEDAKELISFLCNHSHETTVSQIFLHTVAGPTEVDDQAWTSQLHISSVVLNQWWILHFFVPILKYFYQFWISQWTNKLFMIKRLFNKA